MYDEEYDLDTLIEAAGNNDLLQVNRALAEGADPNQVDEYGESALQAACECGSLEVVLRLLEVGADPNGPPKAVENREEPPLYTGGIE